MDDVVLIAAQSTYLSDKIVKVCNRPDLHSAWVRFVLFDAVSVC